MSTMEGPQNSPSKQPLPPPPVLWTPGDVVWGLIIFLFWTLLFGLIGLAAERMAWPVDLGVLVIFGEAILLFPVWFLTVRKYNIPWADLGLRNFGGWAVGIGCGLMTLSLLFNLGYATLLSFFDLQVQPDIAIAFENTNYPILLLFGGAVVAPIVEEIFYRGFVFAGLRGRWRWQTAAVISAGLFALVHFVPTSILPIFLLGLIFAFLYQLSGSIWPAILMHMLTNTVALLSAYAISQGWLPPF